MNALAKMPSPARRARSAIRALPEPVQRVLRRLRNRRGALPQISIGILTGQTPWALDEDTRWPEPVIRAVDVSDARAAFVADPFAVHYDGQWHLFFEFMNRTSGKGEIGCSISSDLHTWVYQGTVLAEEFHLSYPAVYAHDGDLLMVPESWEAGQVRMYRATTFPTTWVLDTVLIDGVAGTDPTLYQESDGTWSMLLCSAEGEHNQTLWRYTAPDLRGPWQEASDSPLVSGRPDQARPGGHVVVVDNRRYRLGQDCSTRYGEALRAYPLDPPSLSSRGDVIVGTGQGWRSVGGHHADLHRLPDGSLLAFVDGETQR